MSDLIDRQAAIDAFEDTSFTKNEIRRRLLELPSVQPEPIGAKRKSTVEILSDLRCQYSCFDEDEEPVYRALSEAIKAVEQPEPHREDGGK